MNRDDLAKARADIGSVKERAFRDIRQLGDKLFGFILLAEDLEEAASLEAVMAQARQGADQAKREQADVQSELAAMREEFTAAAQHMGTELGRYRGELSVAEQRVAEAKTQAAQITAAAEAEAHDIKASARKDANVIAKDAAHSRASIVQAAHDQASDIVTAANRKRDEIDAVIEGQRDVLASIERATADAEARLTKIRQIIAEIAAR